MKNLILILLLLGFGLSTKAQTATLSGYIKEKSTGEDLIGANIILRGKKTVAATSNSYGYFSLTVNPGEYTLEVSFLGYKTYSEEIQLLSSISKNIELSEESELINEVVLTGEKQDENVKSVEMSVSKLTTKEIKKIPQLLGETDIIRTITLLPGISTVGEGANGFNVRGGNVDQNLILLDEAPVFNSSHLFGFFSVFNADAVKDVKLYKGGIPAEYGGRLSSVLDVRQKEGNSKEFKMNGGLGLLSSRLLLEGPIVKDKVSYMVAGRRSYLDIFFGLSDDEAINQSILYFYDLNGKININFSEKSRLFISGYYGNDQFGIQDQFDFGWGNATGTLRWNYLLSDKLFLNLTGVYSDYKYNLGTPDNSEVNFRWNSRIRNNLMNAQFTWFPNPNNTVDFGVDNTYFIFDPAEISGDIYARLSSSYALETGLFISNEQKVSTRLTLQYGLRYAGFARFGEQTIRTYQEGDIIDDNTVISEKTYESGEIIKSYFDWGGFEPRFSANYLLSENNSIKFSYNRLRQFIHLISNTTTPTPVDIWRPSGPHIEPSIVNQVAIGYFHNFSKNKYQLSTEVYYKDFQNLVDYKDNADLIFTEFIETELLSGIGRAYGLEVMFEKKLGNLTGWISYTLSKSERKVAGESRETSINNGEWYLSNYNKTHDITVVANYAISSSWDLGATFSFQSGRPVTYPSARGQFEGITYPVYNNRNGANIPNYHRLDISATYTPKPKEGRRWQNSWSFGVYNAYARRNAYSIFFRQNEINPVVTEAVRLSIFATIIPFVTYNFEF